MKCVKTLSIFFKFRRKLPGKLCRCGVKVLTGKQPVPGFLATIHIFGEMKDKNRFIKSFLPDFHP